MPYWHHMSSTPYSVNIRHARAAKVYGRLSGCVSTKGWDAETTFFHLKQSSKIPIRGRPEKTSLCVVPIGCCLSSLLITRTHFMAWKTPPHEVIKVLEITFTSINPPPIKLLLFLLDNPS